MANRKISDLTALTTPATGDLLPIVDISEAAAAAKNKKITFGELFASIPAGTAAAPSVAFEGYPGTGVYGSGANQVAISTDGTSRIVVDASGNVNIDSNTFYVDAANNRVGIGTTAPSRLLHCSGTGGQEILLTALTSGDVRFGMDVVGSTYNWIDSERSSNALKFGVDNTERVRIDSSGRLGLGVSSPTSLLHLADAGHITVGTTTGTKFGTATTQKLGFYNATPVVQPTAVADATTAVDVITQLNALLAKLRTIGIIAT